jgi:hypothetical protein
MKSQMKLLSLLPLLLMAVSATPARSQTAEQPRPDLQCRQGPVKKTYGGSSWLVYSCDDNRSIVIVSASGNAAMPFYFTFAYSGQGYRLTGEGAGTNESAAAFDELKTVSGEDIVDLIAQTRQNPK